MRFSIEPREGYLLATVHGRETPEQMREFLHAVHAACRERDTPRILISFRQSRAVFKPEDYGLNGNGGGYAAELATPACQIALVGDSDEVHSANEYIELVARQQGLNVRAFRDEAGAARWLADAPSRPARRYRFTRIVITGAPDERGVFALWDGEEIVYYGRADGSGSTIRSRLLDQYLADPNRATHYSWEVSPDPAAREVELLEEHQGAFGRRPKYNGEAA